MRFLTLALLHLFLLVGTHLPAQRTDYESLTIEHGLSQGMIFDVLQTQNGFLWVATKQGLNRYDGYNFKCYTHNPFDPYSLAENTVTALFEDSRGLLWVGTENKGLDLFDRRSGRFYHFPLRFNRNTKSASFEVVAIREAADGSMYVIQRENGLVHLDIPADWSRQLPEQSDLGALTKVTLFPIEQFRLPGDDDETALVAIETGADESVFVYSDKRLYRVETARGFVRPETPAPGNFREVWGAIPRSLVHFQHGILQPERVPQANVSLAKPAAGGGFWLAVNRHLWHVAPGQTPDFSTPDWEVDADISSVETDRNGNIWIGTQGYGLRKINPRKQLFHKGAGGMSIWGAWRDFRGRYYCKVVNKVYPYDPSTGMAGAQPAFPKGPDRILDMCLDASGAYWLLGRGEQEYGTAVLQRYTPETGQTETWPFPFDSIRPGQHNLSTGSGQWFKPYLYARLLQTRNGALWATSLNCQLVRFTPATAQFELADYAHLFDDQAGTVRAFACAEDGAGHIWVGTQLGLVQCRPDGKSFKFQLFQVDPARPDGLNNNSIACLLPDPSDPAGILWIGTKGGGINRLDLRTGVMQHLTTNENLPDDVVYGILPGAPNELWCSTNRGLARLKLDENRQVLSVATFTAAQGLQDNEFNTQAFFKAPNGELLFGGVNGLNHFFPTEVQPDTASPPVFIVGLRINHKRAAFGNPDFPLDQPLEFLKSLELSHEQNNLSFEFAALDFTDPSKNRYRYRLVGADPDWVEVGTQRFAHFTHLSPGKYTLLVQGNNGEGVWKNAGNPISITILPPWWRSGMAYLLYGVLLIAGGWQAYRFQLRRVQIREQLAFEHRETARLKALEQMKTNFFSNVTHEFRTPLTLILEPARRILAHSGEPETRENARYIETNSNRLLHLVNQLLDMAKLESGHMGLNLRHGDLYLTVRDVFERFLPLAEKLGVKLRLHADRQLPLFDFDAQKVEMVLTNLISNALKFTPEGGTVVINVGGVSKNVSGVSNPADVTHVNIRITDTGIGIPAEALPKIFDRFYQVDNGQAREGGGTGIGLALSKELAERMGGHLRAESTPGQGAAFFFRLPVQHTGATPLRESPESEPEAELFPASAAALPDDPERPLALLIEDNAELRAFILKCISSQWQVAEASDGEEGLTKARALLPDIVISDLMMPVKDGYAVCRELHDDELTAHIPVILLTARSTPEAKIKGLQTGADDYLTKPFNSDELLARMHNLVEQRRRLRLRYETAAATGTAAAPDKDNRTAHDREFLRRFTAIVEQDLADETIGVEELARKMCISRVQLHRKLKAVTGRNVTDFVRDYRLERAMAMLRNREGLVYEVAARVGFGSEKYFSRAFKEKFGVSPSQVA